MNVNNNNNRQKIKSFTPGIGIAAGAEDAKYKAKYKELRKKVKEIEAVSVISYPSHPFCRISRIGS